MCTFHLLFFNHTHKFQDTVGPVYIDACAYLFWGHSQPSFHLDSSVEKTVGVAGRRLFAFIKRALDNPIIRHFFSRPPVPTSHSHDDDDADDDEAVALVLL